MLMTICHQNAGDPNSSPVFDLVGITPPTVLSAAKGKALAAGKAVQSIMGIDGEEQYCKLPPAPQRISFVHIRRPLRGSLIT